ncbi:tRNA 2-selenouridine(34) synthase MnmH [bacterium]|nr:tRNA 2-selenouridine(34) synthase MnmH [bacterium]MBU1882807.1 tRNA 2-selenouridine(34) synthase MnmH [bacterium]
MPTPSLSSDFRSIVLNSIPLIDVRAPIEFEKGSFPHAVNLPIMNDKERHEVGICYKEHGNTEAVKLGHKLVGGKVKDERVKAWTDFKEANPEAVLYCFRGGQRSKISQEWMSQAGTDITRLKGGYKAFRNYLMRETEESLNRFKPIILGGRTGSGKTILLKQIQNAIDFEGLANHRGSSFGRKTTPQPTQIDFENALAYELIKKLDKGFEQLVFEDEGKRIGGIYVPSFFASHLSKAPLVILETSLEERIETTYNEYVIDGQKMYGIESLQEWKESILNAIDRIERRLGSKRHRYLCEIFENAQTKQLNDGSLSAHKEWIAYLLTEYYDPMYDYQIQKRSEQIDFKGSSQEVLEYLKLRDSMLY